LLNFPWELDLRLVKHDFTLIFPYHLTPFYHYKKFQRLNDLYFFSLGNYFNYLIKNDFKSQVEAEHVTAKDLEVQIKLLFYENHQ